MSACMVCWHSLSNWTLFSGDKPICLLSLSMEVFKPVKRSKVRWFFVPEIIKFRWICETAMTITATGTCTVAVHLDRVWDWAAWGMAFGFLLALKYCPLSSLSLLSENYSSVLSTVLLLNLRLRLVEFEVNLKDVEVAWAIGYIVEVVEISVIWMFWSGLSHLSQCQFLWCCWRCDVVTVSMTATAQWYLSVVSPLSFSQPGWSSGHRSS